MIYQKRRNTDFLQLKFGFVTYFILLIILAFVINNFRLYMKEYNPNNFLYVHLLNYSFPLVKATSFEEEALSENADTLSEQVIKIAGLNIYDPMKLMGKEMSFLRGLSFDEEEMDLPQITFNINPFNFDESKVIKTNVNGDTSTPPGNQPADNSSAQNVVANVQNPKIKKTLNRAKPEILIYHTHTTESFLPNGNYNQESSKNITSVGDNITSELENFYGVSVIHDKTIHNTSMVKAYARSAETLSKYLNQYGSFKLIIDLHRDAGPAKATTTAKFNNESVAKIMFVLSKQSQYFSKNQEATSKLQDVANKTFPGFCRDVTVYKPKGYYNQNKSPNTVLIEVGSEKNTLEEAQNSGKYIARMIAEYINAK